MTNRFKNIVIDPNSRDWVKEYSDSFDPYPIFYHIAEILGSCSSITDSINFFFNKPSNKYSDFTVSFKNCGFDEFDIKRLKYVHSDCKIKKKGNSVRGRGIRSVIENFYNYINTNDLNSYTTFFSKNPSYKNGALIVIEIAPGMKYVIRTPTNEETSMYNEHMLNAHNLSETNNYGLYSNFIINLNKCDEIFDKNDDVSPAIIKNIKLLLNRRIVLDNLNLVINNVKISPNNTFIKSSLNRKYVELHATIGTRVVSSTRVGCLRISDKSLEEIKQIKDPHFRNLHKIKKYINFRLGGSNKNKVLKNRMYFDPNNIENSWMMDSVERFNSEKTETEPGTWKDKQIVLRFSTTIDNSDDFEYLKHTCGKDGMGGVFFYSENVLVNLRGERSIIQGIMPNKYQFMPSDLNIIRTQVPTLEIEEKYIDLSESKIINVSPVKASVPTCKKNNNFYKCLAKFVNKFFEEHLYYLEEIPISDDESSDDISEPTENIVIARPTTSKKQAKETVTEPTKEVIDETSERNIKLSISDSDSESEINNIGENIPSTVENEIKTTHKKKRVHISENSKKDIAARQGHKCNNSPYGPVFKNNIDTRCLNYKCPMWVMYDGVFDRSRWEIDHIDGDPSNNDSSNLQALCPCCHSFKTLNERREQSRNSPTSH